MSTEDLSMVIELLNCTLNPDNSVRNFAVKKLEELRQNADAFIHCLFKVLQGKNFRLTFRTKHK